MQNNDMTLVAINEMFKELEKTNRKIRRVRMMNRFYFVFSLAFALALHDSAKELIKKVKKENEETE